MVIQIRRALPSDGGDTHALITELAEFEKAAHEVQSTPKALSEQLAASQPP